MPFNATITAGWTYKTGDTVTASNLNALGNPTVTVPDDKTYLVNVGSLSAPGVAFFGDANTGIAQLAGADTASVVVGGAEVVRFAGLQAGLVNGTNSLPSLTWVGDGNTGINHDTAGEVDIVCDGSVIGTWSSTGLAVTGNVAATAMTINGAQVLTSGISQSVVSFATDFIGASTAWGTTTRVSGTGAVAAEAVGGANPDGSSRGIVSLYTPANNDRAAVEVSFATLASTGFVRFRVRPITALSTPTNRYNVFVGMFDPAAVTVSSGTGAWFQYNDGASAQWQTVTYDGATRETQTTSTTYTLNTEYTLEIRRTATSTWQFYINGSLVSTHSSITFGGLTGNFGKLGVALLQTAGSNGNLYVDSIEASTPLTRT